MVAAVLVTAGACGSPDGLGAGLPLEPIAAAPVLTSNILRGDYAGSEECSFCHRAVYEAWRHSPMHKMTRNAPDAAVRAPFDGTEISFKGDSVIVEEHGGQRFMRLRNRDGEALYRITRVIGGRVREDFVGIDVTGASDPVTAPGRGEERVMPMSYVFSTGRWRYKGYSVLVKERPRLVVGGVWRQRCIFCHNTVPQLAALYDDLGATERGYQGSATTNRLPPERQWSLVVEDEAGLRGALVEELGVLGAGAGTDERAAPLPALLSAALRATWQRFGPEHFVEVGIGCEACHNGARQHADDPVRRPSFALRGPVRQVAPVTGTSPTRAQLINRSCARCHTILFSRYAPTWEGGHVRRDPGGSTLNSGEARDFTLGGCADQLACTACHDPHAADSKDAMERLRGAAGTALCTSCHQDLAPRSARAAHTRHDPDGPGASCIDCHMVEKNLGLGHRLTRYHRIGSPNDPSRVERDRPLECALCHADRSAGELVNAMEAWWGRRYDRRALVELYGDLAANPLVATLELGRPHEQAVAAAVIARAGDAEALPRLAALLDHAYPLVRYFVAQAIADLAGEWPAVDVEADPDEIRAAARVWLDRRRGASEGAAN